MSKKNPDSPIKKIFEIANRNIMNNNTKITYTPKGPDIEGTSGPFLTSRLMWRELASESLSGGCS